MYLLKGLYTWFYFDIFRNLDQEAPNGWQIFLLITPEPGPCSGFNESYIAFSNFFGTVPQPDVLDFIVDLDEEGKDHLDLNLLPGLIPKTPISIDLESLGQVLSRNNYLRYYY